MGRRLPRVATSKRPASCGVDVVVFTSAGLPSPAAAAAEAGEGGDWHDERTALQAIYAEDVSFPSASCTVLSLPAEPDRPNKVKFREPCYSPCFLGSASSSQTSDQLVLETMVVIGAAQLTLELRLRPGAVYPDDVPMVGIRYVYLCRRALLCSSSSCGGCLHRRSSIALHAGTEAFFAFVSRVKALRRND